MAKIELKGREIPLLFTVWEMKAVQEEIGPLNKVISLALGRNPEDPEDRSGFLGPEHLKAATKMIRIIGNAGLEEAGETPDLTDKKVARGIRPIDLPEADLILLSLDGDRAAHNAIRGDTYDTIMENVRNASADNICFYMAINRINKGAIQSVCAAARNSKNVRAVSFNFHTPYPDTR